MFDFLGSMFGGSSFKDTLDRAKYAVQDKLGKFLSSGQRIIDLRDQAAVYAKSTTPARDRANALLAQADALLNSLNNIQNRAMLAIGEASDLRAKMDTDPFWKNLTAADWSSFGFETMKKAKEAAAQVSRLAASLYAINKDMDDHMAKVQAFAGDVGDLTGVAQGTGVNRLFGVADSAGRMLKTNSLIISIGALAALTFLAWDFLAPAKAARRASR